MMPLVMIFVVLWRQLGMISIYFPWEALEAACLVMDLASDVGAALQVEDVVTLAGVVGAVLRSYANGDDSGNPVDGLPLFQVDVVYDATGLGLG